MSQKKKPFRAIDLFSGVGGWSLGLAMAGIDVVASYEWWAPANLTNFRNNRHETTEADIRTLALSALPKDIDIVVGSPPCTQFSFANRGGSGDIEDGLKDVAKFFEVVTFLRPRFWAMENVPRVAGILQKEMQRGGSLERFAGLKPVLKIVDVCEWGVPQRRQRCIAGNFDMSLLEKYRPHTQSRTLGNVVRSLAGNTVKDPNYGIEISRQMLVDHEKEEYLSAEEERMNREMKTFHPVYNNMAFPDPLTRPGRTITATCTRVSRESLVIAAPERKERYRRLTIRERSCLQGFPITYQFYGRSYAQKLKMIGNAVPPLFTFYVAQAILGVSPGKVLSPEKAIKTFTPPLDKPPDTFPDKAGETYPLDRRFRSAIPHLRFKSGVRFELSNFGEGDKNRWAVRFFFGNSKNISELALNNELLAEVTKSPLLRKTLPAIRKVLRSLEKKVGEASPSELQAVWNHTQASGVHPYAVVDQLGQAAESLITLIGGRSGVAESVIDSLLAVRGRPMGSDKVLRLSDAVLAGIFVGITANKHLQDRRPKKPRRGLCKRAVAKAS